ncbi:hypothetical protein [Paenibacillus sp. BJ-4]|uniref:hypothetical protein n=1 Tax=Paenibacillus sp. BJ-4 TaxID=2878097 RepID=UPI001CF067BE|nr:hypothetical protein [Paenibacillus sp. BJ-4]
MKPNVKNLYVVTEKFEQFGISYALGGSGLLYSLGLTTSVSDWDVMTEATKDSVMNALQNYEVEETISGDYPYGTEYKLLVHNKNPKVEIIGRLAIHTNKGLCRMPSISVSEWNGIQVASPEVWYVAYALMNRKEKADLLLSFLKGKGANKETIKILMNEPLSDEIIK